MGSLTLKKGWNIQQWKAYGSKLYADFQSICFKLSKFQNAKRTYFLADKITFKYFEQSIKIPLIS